MNAHENPASLQLERLISELLDGKLDEQQRQLLCTVLRDNPTAQDLYRNMMAVHALLHLDFGGIRQVMLPPVLPSQGRFSPNDFDAACGTCADVVAEIDADLDDPQSEKRHSDTRQSTQPMPRIAGRLALAFATLAAGLLFVVWNLSPLQTRRIREREAAREEFAQSEVRGVAVLAQAADANWGNTQQALPVGGPLSAGRFNLESGLVQIEFFSGATVVIEAPADFQLESPMKLVCNLGRMRANVPSQAHGFTIETPKYAAVDLGTEFTVQVDDKGESEIHVLNGEVELWDRKAARRELAQLLTTGRGVRSTPDGGLSQIVNSASTFVGSEQVLERSRAEFRQRFKEWKVFSETMRKDPRAVLYYGFDEHAPWERVLRNNSSNGNKLLDGAIVGCHWTTGRWADKQALEFKRTSDRVRLNIPGEFESLTFAAWVRIEGLERWLSSLMLTDGHQLGEVHWQMTELGQLMLGVKVEAEESYDFYSPSVLSPRDLGRWVHLGCVYNGEDGYVAHYVDGTEVGREKIRIPTTLRIGAAEIGNWVPEDLRDNRVRSLNGRVDELLILDSALSSSEILEIYEAGKPQ